MAEQNIFEQLLKNSDEFNKIVKAARRANLINSIVFWTGIAMVLISVVLLVTK